MLTRKVSNSAACMNLSPGKSACPSTAGTILSLFLKKSFKMLNISRNRGHSLLCNHISSVRTADREGKNIQGFVWILKEKSKYLS